MMFFRFDMSTHTKKTVTYGTIQTYHPGMGGQNTRNTANTIPHRLKNSSRFILLAL